MSYPTDLKTSQPAPLAMTIDGAHEQPEKHSTHSHAHGQCQNCRHISRSKAFKRTAALSASLLALAFFVLVSTDDDLNFDIDFSRLFGCMRGVEGSGSPVTLSKRQSTTGSSGNTGSGQSVFVKNKFYLIVALVGLAVVVLLMLCLSACCCREAFENPICCPCYLCACCGGLACLECIACGFCMEAAEQVV